jgi:hypothetical protein
MQKTDMSKSRYVKKPTIKKPICQKADILLIFFPSAKSRYVKKPICQKADNQKTDLSKSRYFAPPLPFKGEGQKKPICNNLPSLG